MYNSITINIQELQIPKAVIVYKREKIIHRNIEAMVGH